MSSSAASTETRRKPGPRPTVCAACHVAKIKCDRKRPCNHCARRKLQCVFGDEEDEEEEQESGNGGKVNRRRKRRKVELKKASVRPTAISVSSSSSSSSASSSSSSSSASSSSNTLSSPGRNALSPTLYSSPSSEYARRTWFDNLLTFFGSDPYAARRRVQNLLKQANGYICEMHRFELTDPFFIRKALKHPQSMTIIDLSMIFALTAIGLRIEAQRAQSSSSDWQILPRDAVGLAHGTADTSVELEKVAETYWMQALSSSETHTSSLQVSLRLAQTSAYLMTLQSALSERFLHFHRFALSVARSAQVRHAVMSDDVGKFGFLESNELNERHSTVKEEAARLSLFPHWTLIQLGATIPNLEFHTLQLNSSDLEDVAVCLPWPSKKESVESSKMIGDELNVKYQTQGIDIVRKTIRAWQIPFADNYVEPSLEFDALLSEVEAKEDLLGKLGGESNDDPHAQRYLARCAVAVCHMHGIIIRRTGFLHNQRLRPAVIAALHVQRTEGGSTSEHRAQAAADAMANAGLTVVTSVWQETLETPALQIWLGLIERLSEEVRQKQDKSDAHHLDSLSLYAAATSQYSQGVRNLYALLGHPFAEQVEIVIRLNTAADVLRGLIERKRRQTSAEIGRI